METPTYSDPPQFTKSVDGSPDAASEKVARAAHTTVEAMKKAADYVRVEELDAMIDDAQQLVKRHPGATLLAAAAAGFLLARIFSRH